MNTQEFEKRVSDLERYLSEVGLNYYVVRRRRGANVRSLYGDLFSSAVFRLIQEFFADIENFNYYASYDKDGIYVYIYQCYNI